jgi:PadR family transcriptional regulator PadR
VRGDQFKNFRLELRRGSLVLAVLSQLRSAQYGYMLRKVLAAHRVTIDLNTPYPLLWRLEHPGLVVSEWRKEDKRNRRFYRSPSDGKVILRQLLAEWKSIDASLSGTQRGQENRICRSPRASGLRGSGRDLPAKSLRNEGPRSDVHGGVFGLSRSENRGGLQSLNLNQQRRLERLRRCFPRFQVF